MFLSFLLYSLNNVVHLNCEGKYLTPTLRHLGFPSLLYNWADIFLSGGQFNVPNLRFIATILGRPIVVAEMCFQSVAICGIHEKAYLCLTQLTG